MCSTKSNSPRNHTGEVGNVCKTPENLNVNLEGDTQGNENNTNLCNDSTGLNIYRDGSRVLNPYAVPFETTLPPSICGQTTSNNEEYSDTPGKNIVSSECNCFDQITTLRLKNPKKVILGHLNINSLPNKFTGIMDLVKGNLDIFLISETKIDSSFPDAQFYCDGFSSPHRRDRFLGGGGLLLYVNENIPSRMLNHHYAPDDIEAICVEINLRKQKWVIIGIYRPPSMNETYFLENVGRITDFYNCKYDKVIIMGDFNQEPSEEGIETLCSSHNLYNLVHEKNCFKGPPKCYDLILTNEKHKFQNTQALFSGFSDFHKMTITVMKTTFVKADPININYRDYKNYNPVDFQNELKGKLGCNDELNINYNKFQTIVCEVLDKHAPIKKKTLRANNSPFMTKSLRKMFMNRSRCKNYFYKNRTVENWEKYRKLRNDCVKMTKKVKREYFENLNLNSITDNKKFWKSVKPNFTNKIKKNEKIILVEKEHIISENKQTAEIMNDYFVNITKELNIPEEINTDCESIFTDPIDAIIKTYSKHPSILKIKENVKVDMNFNFNQINQSQIEKEILSLNSKKSTGADSIPPKVLKHSLQTLKSPMTQLFNNMVGINHFPSELKYANVTPIFKKGDAANKENYRPISILPSISKVFERLIFQQITSYVTDFLSPYLCGFRKGYSTQHALLRLFDQLNKNLDKKGKVGLLLMDLSKAFDCISHDLLLAKLHAYNFDKSSLKLIYSYLKGRHQRVHINGEYSTWKEILSGVPQGSVLGPLLFNIFINDLFFFVKNSEIHNYADDNTLSVADTNIDIIVSKLQSDINIIDTWFKSNGLLLNEKKCQFMIIEPITIRNNTEKIKVSDKILEEVKQSKLLGISFDNNINMKDYIKSICNQAGKKLNALARISHYLGEHKRKLLMNAFITSQFNYCPIIWMFCQRKSNNLINRIHERALRIAYNDYTSNFESLLREDDSVTIHHRNIQSLSLEIYKTMHEFNPVFMKNIFSQGKHNYTTRNEQLSYPNPRTVTYGLESFGYKATQIWRCIPQNIQNNRNINTFKKYTSDNCSKLCKCNICKEYIANLGYI